MLIFMVNYPLDNKIIETKYYCDLYFNGDVNGSPQSNKQPNK